VDREGTLALWLEDPRTQHHVSVFDAGRQLLVCCSATGDFLVDSIASTVVGWRANGSLDAWEHRLVATALPLMLAERGDLVLHASGVATHDGRGVLFCGPPGRGKSTIAATLAAAGRPVIGEDGIALTLRPGESVLAWPGPAGVRLSPSPGGIKRTEPTPGRLETTTPVPVSAVALLDPRVQGGPTHERLPGTTALALLSAHAMYAGAVRLPRVFSQLARLAAEVPVHRVQMPDDLSVAPAAAQWLLDRVLQP
jgi:energy-coupling factor transporter ATP-binding protein EcfA2